MKERAQGKWLFGLLWVIVNTFSWGMLFIVSRIGGWIAWEFYDNFGSELIVLYRAFRIFENESIRSMITLVVISLCWGAIFGLLQQFVLRLRFEIEGKKWVLATIIGLTVYLTLQTLVPSLAANTGFRAYQIFTGISTFAYPFALGIAQWFILRRYFARSGWWIVAIVITDWLLHFLRLPFATGQVQISVFIVNLLLNGFLYGVTTLVVLTVIFKQSPAAVEG